MDTPNDVTITNKVSRCGECFLMYRVGAGNYYCGHDSRLPEGFTRSMIVKPGSLAKTCPLKRGATLIKLSEEEWKRHGKKR